MTESTDLDIIVYGATGFTGRLVVEYLLERYGLGLRLGLAGRDSAKLEALRETLGAPADLPLLVAAADDAEALATIASRTKVVLSTAGPYQLYGSTLVEACAAAGTDYVDLCGEPYWMRRMIDAHHDTARRTGARIVFSCGFDSIPFELGVLALQEAAFAATGRAVGRVKGRVLKMQGSFSGGTLASLRASDAAAAADPAIAAILNDPFALTPGFSGPDQPAGDRPEFDDDLELWVAPFVMAAINTRNVHRSNYLMAHRYGSDFVYDEMIVTGSGSEGEAAAQGIMAMRAFMASTDGPKPGEGPSKAERDAGSYDLLFQGLMSDGRTAKSRVTGDRDPGYGSTSKIIAEAALCLLREVIDTSGGVWTPGAAMGPSLIARLTANAGLSFVAEVEPVSGH